MDTDTSIDTKATSYKSGLLAEFIAKQHGRIRGKGRPLIVSMQGPQGAGKSTLAAALVSLLGSAFDLKAAVASLDDFYLDRRGLDTLARTYLSNKMLHGRGPPGTHDIQLLKTILEKITNPSRSSSVDLPIFDKSLFDGRGDRSQATISIKPPELDVFILEGWSLGFQRLPVDQLQHAWKAGQIAKTHDWESILQINENLSQLNENIDDYFDCHISITPLDLNYVYEWRLQQEHHMKRENGGSGMSDEQVKLFINRYMPCYEVYGNERSKIDNLRLNYGSEREVIKVEEE